MELHYTSNQFMLNLLSQVQPLQANILETGHSAHLDADAFNDHISFDLTIFHDNAIVESFEFSALDSEEELFAELQKLQAFIKNKL